MSERKIQMDQELKTKLASRFVLYRMIEEEDFRPFC